MASSKNVDSRGSVLFSESIFPYVQNVKPKLVEIGTYLPLRQQLAELKRAGVDSMAFRQAHSQFVAGERVDLNEPFEDFNQLDEFDIDAKTEFFLRQEQIKQMNLERQKQAYEAKFADYLKQKDQKTEKPVEPDKSDKV